MSWYEKHRARLEAADAACRSRGAYTPFIESPSRKLHRDGAKQQGQARFEAALGGTVEGTAPKCAGSFVAEEVSPFSGEPLGVAYARPSVEQVFAAATAAISDWKRTTPEERLGVCLEALDRLADATFENAFATMHTTGQPFVMAFAGSGANSLDRGLEALVYAKRAMADVTPHAFFHRTFGKAQVQLQKRYRLVPRGVAIVITCGSYPAWNAYPSIFANLATGNPVVVKPHPATILPLARSVQIVRETIAEAGFDPNLVVLAPDTTSEPIASALVDHPSAAIVDFTGSPRFGAQLENRADRLVFTETAGCNAVIIDSVEHLGPVLDAIAQGLCLHSGQMCTTPQNIFIPPNVRTRTGDVSYLDVRDKLIAAVDALLSEPERAAGVCGAVHNPRTLERVQELEAAAGERLLRRPTPYPHPRFPNARTCTPLFIEESIHDPRHRQEHFGPVAFVLPTQDRKQALRAAADDARTRGAIASYAYSTDPAFRSAAEDAFFEAGASIGFNLIRQTPINFTAAFSDYHVTGLNPAGNACLTDLAFVAGRFRIVQSKTEILE